MTGGGGASSREPDNKDLQNKIDSMAGTISRMKQKEHDQAQNNKRKRDESANRPWERNNDNGNYGDKGGRQGGKGGKGGKGGNGGGGRQVQQTNGGGFAARTRKSGGRSRR